MKDSGKFSGSTSPLHLGSHAAIRLRQGKLCPGIDLSPRIELSLAVDVEADSEIPEPTEN